MINVDGKTLRGAKEAGNSRSLIHMVSVWSASQHLVLGQKKVGEKSNEIIAIPALLKMLVIRGCVVSIDAMGCQTEIANTIIEQGADYVLALKGNQGHLHDDVRELFTSASEHDFKNIEHQFDETVEKRHGRIETRRYWTMGNTEYLIGAEKWRDLKSIGMVESKRIPELGTIQWANDADLDADVLYAAVSGQAIADFDQLISTVEGDVIKLYRPRKARVDKITVQDTISKRQVQIDLPEREYAIATSAHQQQKLIICYENLAVSIIKSNHVMYFVRSQYSDNNHIKIG